MLVDCGEAIVNTDTITAIALTDLDDAGKRLPSGAKHCLIRFSGQDMLRVEARYYRVFQSIAARLAEPPS